MTTGIEDLAAVRARLLQRRLAGRAPGRREPTLPTTRRGGPIPLSAGQRQMWFLSRLEPDSWEYAAPLVLRLTGALDPTRLRSAIDAVVARHEILRTRYRLVDHRPVQVIDPAGAAPFEFVEMTDSAGAVATATDLAYRFCGRPFDLAEQWPLRVQLIEIGPDEHLLTVLFHHIACDDWSVRVFLTDLRTAYRGRSLAELPVQWADYAAAEAERADETDLAFWRTELSDLAPLDLPADRPRPARRDWHGATETFAVPPAVAHGLAELARTTDTTPFMVLLTAFQVLLGRYTGRTDVPVGTVVSTRTRPEMQELIGYGINSLVLRGRWSGDPTFAELLTANRTRVGQAFAHVAMPFARLVDDLQPERDMSRTPLFQVAFAMQESRAGAIELPGLAVTAAGAPSPVARFDLTLQVEWDRDRPVAHLEYATALFDASTVRRMASHLQRLLSAVAADAQLAVSALPILGADELARLVPARAVVEAEPVPGCLHQLLRAQVAARPDAPAVLVDGEPGSRLSYAELNRRSNRLAHHLRGLGARPESIVGVCLSRGPELVPALLGVLKADAAYLPLDPAQPSDRLTYMVGDARARIIVTTSDLRPRLGGLGADVVVVLLDRLFWQDESAADPIVRARPDNLAYVIYTSGSTGRPKGVCVTHANVVRLLARGHELYDFSDQDVWPLFHSYAFDVSVWELWGALLFGGTLVVVPSPVTRSPEDFLDLLVRHRVTMLNQTPTAFRGLVALAGAGDPRMDELAVRAVVFAGEKLEFADLSPWVARRDLATTRLANMYGITETTVHSSYYPTRPADLDAPLGNPVGEPLADLRIYLLDPDGRPVPTGVPGEIHVGGPGVTRGYLNRPELTAARFVPDPFGAPGGRLYRSGDLAHRSPDGGLHFDGRIDDQVKIRGFRIELAEIQLALGAQPDVREAVVVVREPTPGDRRLVAYLVPDAGRRLDPERLRADLGRTLPEYMIPSAFVALASLPLTTNGKLDKRALPAPGRADMSTGAGFLAPRTDRERRLAQIWRDVLEVPAVGVDDSFFDLGGDSIRAVALAGAMSAAGLPVSVRDLFSYRTIGQLAGHLTGDTGDAGDAGTAPDSRVEPFALIDTQDRDRLPAGVVDAYPVAQAQLGMLVSMLADEQRNPYHNVTSFRIRDARPVSAPALRAAAAEVTRRHEVLRTGFDLDSYSRPLQLVHAAAQMPVQVHDLAGLDGAAVRDALLAFQSAERARVFDIRTPALLRLAAHGGDDGGWWLSITECHPILEGWSHHSLLMELLGLYEQFRDGQPVEPYAAPDVRFADFVAAELAALDSPADQEYWRRVAAVPTFSLPDGWGAPPPAGDPLTESYVVAVPVHDLDPALRELARAAGASLKAVMLAAHLKVLSQLTAERTFTAGLVCDGRPEVSGADRVYGMYINTLPFVHDRTAGTWRELVAQVLAREIELWPHRRFPLPAIQRAVGADSLVDVYFNYQDFRQLDAGMIDHPATLDNSVTEFGMSVSSRGGHIHLTAHPQTLDRAHAQRILGMYRAVLEAMAADPDGDARAVRLPAEERAAALQGLTTGPNPPVARTIPAAFAAQVARTPDAPAVHCGEHTLSYRALAALAADLSGRLARHGTGPERLVAICLDRGPALVPALLGVLGSGAAYLPIEPNLPTERIAFLLADAAVDALVTDAANAAALAPLLPGRVLVVDPDAVIDPAGYPVPPVDPDALAYVMYTSGSTGAPKGVMATHANVLSFLAAAGERFGFGADDVWAAAHSFGFDVSVWEIFGALLVGGQVAVLPWSTVRSPEDLLDALVRYRVTVLDQTPSAFRGLVHLAAQDDPRIADLALRTVLLAGERPAPAELPPWTDRRGWHSPRLYNLYGITETTVESAAQQFEPVDVSSGLNRAGRPFAGIGMVVLDADGEPVPVGVPGEIHLAGHGLARGYLGRPDLTAARFVPNPFGPPGSRLYRSGDLGRLRPDGGLEVLGRIDDQVKIRGYRVEPGEIAAQLRRCPGVRDAVVTVHDGDVLMATVVPDPDHDPDHIGALEAATIVRWCADRLPDYLVPAAVVFRDALPLTATGKIDRAALGQPDRAAMPALRAALAPRTDVEARLVQVWCEVLDLDEIGVEDSFFQLGGDSIRVLTLVTRMRAAGFPAAVRDVFEQQTVARLAELLTGRPAPVEIEPVAPFALLTDADRNRLPDGLTDAYPLSQVQLGMVVQTLTDGDVNAYQSVNSFLVENEEWSEPALRAAVAGLPTRHETLRTAIDLTGYSVPLQLVQATAAIPLRIVDLRGQDEAGQRRAVTEFVAEQGRELFDLTLAPLTRFTVHRLADDRWRLTFTQSHAITEGWSYHQMLMELLADYRDRRDGRVPTHPEPPAVRYADFIAAEQAALDSASDRAFWAELVSDHPRLELPATWRPRQTAEPEMILGGVRLESVEAGLRALAVRARVSMKAVFLAAHLKVLSQLTAQDRFCTGLVWDTRPEAAGADRVLGMHLNTLPFKGQRPTGSWTDWVQRVFADELAAFAHRRLPLPAIQRQAGGAPLLNVIFTYLDFHVARGDAVDLDATIANSPTEFDLNVTTLGGLLGLSSTTRVIGRTDMDRLSAMYGAVLTAMAADPDGDAGAVHLPAGERDRLLHEWNPPVRLDQPALLHERFAAVAAARPDAVAVVCGTDRRTYAQVNAQANRLAHHLRSCGVGPDELVGVCLERGPELIPAVLGVLKAGAAYLPIDPATPADRRAFMLADSGARILITATITADIATGPLAVDPAITVVDLHADAATIGAGPDTDPVTVSTPDNLIYAIYTSGSTGVPKGVLLTHANVDALFAATQDRVAMGADDVWTLFHSYAFDVSVWEMWGALRHGGTLVVVPADVARNPDAFLDLLVAERVSILSQTPSAFRSLVAAAADGDPRIDRLSLRAVVFGGERLDFAALLPWVRRVGLDRPALLNLYGITETTVHSSFHRLVAADFDTPEVSRVGLPLPGWSMHVLDPHGHPVPIGVPGEIHVGGPGLARGYLGRPQLTADRFGPDPFAAAPGGRLYRSGDIGRRLPDGTIESLGRADDQVKIRGYRVELGEVAAALSALPEVADAVVLLIEQSLVGYLVPVAGADVVPADLRDRLRRSLPEYMVPAALVTVPAFPTTTNGKLDKAALPRPGFDALARRAPFVPPRTPLEERLAAGWAAALGLDRIGVQDSFFDVGGDSLRAVALVGALRAAGLNVDVRDVFVQQSIARLAAELERRATAAESGDGAQAVTPFTPVAPFALLDPADRDRLPADVVDAYPATQAQVGMAVQAQADPDHALYTIVSSFRIWDERPVEQPALARAVAELVERHEALRTSVQLTGYSVPLQLVHRTATVPVRVIDHPAAERPGIDPGTAGPDLAGFAAAERAAGVDLTVAPLLRVAAHQDRGAWWLTLTVSHLIVGGWDLNSLLADLVAGYRRCRAGRTAPVTVPAVRFADFVAAERQAVADPAEGAFWRTLLVDHPPLRLPEAWAEPITAGRPAPAARQVSVSYRDLDADLRTLAARCGTSVKAVLHAAHLTVMSGLTELPEFSVGLVADARPEQAGAERVLGMYINSLPFPHRRSDRTWADLVRAVFAAELAIWPHRRFPLGAITAAAGQSGQGPLLEVLFDFNDFHQVDEAVVDVEASLGDAATEFPLTVSTVGGLIHLATSGGRIGPAELDRLAGSYRAVLEAMVADPDGDAQATFLTPADHVRLTREWPRGAEVAPTDMTAPAAFARQVAATPAATAVTFVGGALSYADLDRRAARIAGGLTARGVAAGDMVGVLLDRGPDLVAALLGVWRVGAAFVPLDPAHPAGRLTDMLADVRAGLVIADRAVDLGVPVATVAELDRAAGTDPTGPAGKVDPDLPAYVIFTSGSTGRPKGVLTSHRNLWAYLHPWATDLATRGAGGAPLFSSPAVDFSMTVLWGPLCTGRVLALAPADLELADLGGWLAAAGPFGVVSLTPAHLQLLDEQLGAAAGAAVAGVYLVGGEALPTELAARWSTALGAGGLINEYGPTEITVANCAFALPPGDPDGRIPIGRPLPGTTAYVLDSRLQPVPAGVPGEIWVGGPGVALGYAGRPGLTADRFRPDPFGPPGARLYRTGDLGRWLPDGVLDCLGRADDQVKIRGHRIELGEIRAVLVAAGARDAAVLVRAGRLVAWVAGEVAPDELREQCRRRLPAPMIPAAFVPVDALPITPNGKLDRLALPDPDSAAGAASAPPVGAAERLVAGVWTRRLGVEIGRDDDFFDRGGDSLRAVGVIGELRAAGYAVSVRDLFARRTVRALAAGLDPGVEPEPATVAPFALLEPADRAALPDGLTDAYPMSQVQLGMLAEMTAARGPAGRGAYHSVLAHRIADDGPLDPDALRAAVALVLRRHDTLRTSFALSGFSVPLQLVQQHVELPVPVIDGRGLDAQVARERLEQYLAAERTALLDPARAPQLRLAAHLEDDRTWWLTISISHAITEGWSLRLLVDELLDAYRQRRAGDEVVLPDVPDVRYADFIAGELAALADPDDAAYWLGVTADYPAARVPTGWQDPGPRAVTRARVDLTGRGDRLRDFARTTGVPLKAVLHALHLKVLGQLTGDAAYASGLVCDARPEVAGADRLLGMFLNTVPFGHDRSTGSWRELARRVFDREVQLWPHRRFPVPAIQRAAGRRVVEILFNYQDLDRPAAGEPGSAPAPGTTTAVRTTVGEGATEFALSVIASPTAFDLQSESTVLGERSLARIAGMLDAAVDALLADPDGSSGRLCLPAGDHATPEPGVSAGIAVDAPAPTGTLAQRFADQAAATPDAVAVRAGDGQLTYRELDCLANRLAHRLIELGAGPGTLVGVCLDRGPDLIPALLAVLKSGAAYLPLDPVQPPERLAYMLGDAGAPIVITHSAQRPLLPATVDGTVLLLDDEDLTDRPATAPVTGCRADDLVYVIYTSGSTGRPKGVCLTHVNVLRLIDTGQEHYGFDETDCWPLFHSFAFDVSVWEMWGALLHGGRLVVVPQSMLRSPGEFLDLLLEQRVTVLNQTPSAFRALVDLAAAGDPRIDRLALRTVVFAGEKLDMPMLAPWVARHGLGRVALINMYGITETTVHTTYHRITRADLTPGAANRIGRPLADLRIELIDSAGEPVPTGVIGEITVSGPGVARGYLGRPALTAERFEPDPHGPAGSRRYRSGDRARRRPDGTFEFCGRIDDQIKIRGFRVEPGEVRAAVTSHPAVADALVVGHAGPAGPSLVAYVVPEAGQSAPTPADLRSYLLRRLPDYMVPGAYLTIAAFPLTPNGKLDRRALPVPELAVPARGAFVAPRTTAQRQLAEIFSRVLGVPDVGLHDRFFDLGGHSIAVVRVVAEANAVGLQPSLRMLYENRTLGELAAELEPVAAPPTALPTAPVDRPRPPARPVPSPLASMAEHRVPGVSIAMVTGGELTGCAGFGVVCEGGDPVRPETIFPVASVSKLVTAVGALQLVRRGVLDLDVDVNRYLTQWRIPGDEPVTLRQLLGHTSGLSAPEQADYPPGAAMPELVELLAGRPPVTSPPIGRELRPGAEFRAANSNYAVVQQVIADATGLRFADLMREQVFAPLGMTHSSFDPPDPAATAWGHDAQGGRRPEPWRIRPDVGAAGLFSTAIDLARVAIEIRRSALDLGPSLLGPELAGQMLRSVPGAFYGLGTLVDDSGGDVEYGHTGECTGFRSLVFGRLRSGDAVVILTNGEAGNGVFQHLAAVLAE